MKNDLISRKALLDDIEKTILNSGLCNHEEEIMDCIKYSSAVETERHGTWLPKEIKDQFFTFTNYFCSVCGRKLIGYKYPEDAPYCHCGCRMDGDTK